LRRRSRRASGLLRHRSGVHQCASHSRCGVVDQGRYLLRRRSRWASGLLRLCSGVHPYASDCIDGLVDRTRVAGRSNGSLRALSLVGRLPARGDGQ
jgi:hypothetical protein